MRKLNSLKLLLSALLLAIGCNVWGETAEIASKAPANGDFIIALYHSGEYYALTYPGTSNVSSVVGKKCTLNTAGDVVSVATLDSPEKCIWKFTEGTGTNAGTYQIQSYGTDGRTNYYLYKAGTSGSANHNMLQSNSSQYWEFTQTTSEIAKYSMLSMRGSANTIMTNNSGSFYLNGTTASYDIYLLKVATGPTLTKVSVSGTPTKTTYIDGDAFDPAGLVVTGTYNEGDPQTITEGITWGVTPTTLTEGSTSVSVTATVSGITSSAYIVDGLTVNPIPTHTATFYVNGSVFGEPENVKEGAAITFPAEDPADIDSKKFMGWAESTISGTTQTAPSFVTSATMGTGDKNFYAVFATVTGEEETDKTFYFEPFAGSAHSNGFDSDNIAATQDMFSDKEATVWSHYTATGAPSTTSYATNLDGSDMSNGIKIYQQINNTTKTILEVKGIDISGGKNLALSLYNRRTYTSATLIIEYKIDNVENYTSVGGTIQYNSTNDKWKYCDGLTISGTGSTLDLKISVKVTGTTNRIMLIDDVKLYGKHGGATYSDYCTTVAYTRSVTAGNYGTICLPYGVAADAYSGATFYNVGGVTKQGDAITGIVLVEEEGALEAGKPYIFQASANEIVLTYSGEPADVQPANGLMGNLGEEMTIAASESTFYYVLSGTTLYHLAGTSTATIGKNKAYLNLEGIDVYQAPAQTQSRVAIIPVNGQPTALENSALNAEVKKVVIDGQMMIIRGGNMFDLNGRLVK